MATREELLKARKQALGNFNHPNGLSDSITIEIDGISFEMVLVKAGSFLMGDKSTNETMPIHRVMITKNYYLAVSPVTNELWEVIMSEDPFRYNYEPNEPAEVSWDEAQLFIQKLNEKTGKKFRLPTEAEWEFAARGGHESQGYIYSGSDDIDEVAWYCENSDEEVKDVCRLEPNELGLYDMSGNASEWCQDWYDEEYYGESPLKDPQGPEDGDKKVCRGGSSWSDKEDCTVSSRFGEDSDYCFDGSGFRLLMEI